MPTGCMAGLESRANPVNSNAIQQKALNQCIQTAMQPVGMWWADLWTGVFGAYGLLVFHLLIGSAWLAVYFLYIIFGLRHDVVPFLKEVFSLSPASDMIWCVRKGKMCIRDRGRGAFAFQYMEQRQDDEPSCLFPAACPPHQAEPNPDRNRHSTPYAGLHLGAWRVPLHSLAVCEEKPRHAVICRQKAAKRLVKRSGLTE